MADVNEQQVVADFARQIVGEVAPDELPLFRPLSQAYFKNPEKALQGSTGKDKMLGFGATEAMVIAQTLPILHATAALAFELARSGLADRIVNPGTGAAGLGLVASGASAVVDFGQGVGSDMAKGVAAHIGFIALERLFRGDQPAREAVKELPEPQVERIQGAVLDQLRQIADAEQEKRIARAILARLGFAG